MASTVKLNGVTLDVIKLQVFPFSLRDTTTSWFESLPYGSVNNWEYIFPSCSHFRDEERNHCIQVR